MTRIVYASLMTMASGQRLASPMLTKAQTGNIIFQVTSNDTTQSKSIDKSNEHISSTERIHLHLFLFSFSIVCIYEQ